MADVSEAEVLERLGRVPGPNGSGDLVSLGMIGGLAIKGGHVTFAIQVDPKRGAALEPLRRAAEAAVDAIPGVLSVTAVLTAERPMQAPQRAPERQGGATRPPVPGVRAIVAVASGKGGV